MPRSSTSSASKRSNNPSSGQNGTTLASKRHILSRSSSNNVSAGAVGTQSTSDQQGTTSVKQNGLIHRNSSGLGSQGAGPNGVTTGADVKTNGKVHSGSGNVEDDSKSKNLAAESHKQIDIKPTSSLCQRINNNVYWAFFFNICQRKDKSLSLL